MQKLKNIVIGFFVSFAGSIPLGFLNLVGFEIFLKNSWEGLIYFLLGVVAIEGFVIYLTLKFASYLTKQKKWMMRLDVFTIIFLLCLSSTFFSKSGHNEAVSKYINYVPFITGLLLSSLNFVQIPFWTGWNLYLLNNKYIVVNKPNNYFYLMGTVTGTFLGMLSLVYGLSCLSQSNAVIDQNFILKAIPLVFFILALFQMVQFYKKYYRKIN